MSCNTAAFAVATIRRWRDLISSTTTETGLKVHCELDANEYPKGVIVSDEEMTALNIERDHSHGEWNYTIKPSCRRSTEAVI